MKKEKPSIIHTHTFKAGMIGRLIPGEHKLVHTFHGHLFDDQSFSSFQKFSIRLIEKILARRTDLLISVGEKVGREIREAGIGVGENWGSISPGVTALPKYSKSKARKALGLTETGKLVGWMARMTEVKNPFRLLEISRSMPNVNFVMAGGGNLLELVRQYAPSNVHIIGWTDASQFWSAIDCVVSTSDNEGMPIALIEAQLASLPVVCTNAGSSEEVILDGVTGYVRERNALDLKEALEKVIYDESLIKAMGAKGRSHATEKFSLKKMISLHKYYYGNLISNSKPN